MGALQVDHLRVAGCSIQSSIVHAATEWRPWLQGSVDFFCYGVLIKIALRHVSFSFSILLCEGHVAQHQWIRKGWCWKTCGQLSPQKASAATDLYDGPPKCDGPLEYYLAFGIYGIENQRLQWALNMDSPVVHVVRVARHWPSCSHRSPRAGLTDPLAMFNGFCLCAHLGSQTLG